MLSIGMVTGHRQIPVIRLGLLSQAGALTKARAANLSGLARVNPLLKFVHLGGGPRAVARHLTAAQGADDGVGMLGDIFVIEQIKRQPSSSRGPSPPEQGP
jgi:hypothetical protein